MTKEITIFAKNAIKNGYTGERCQGWDWIEDNLTDLDFIFQTKEYKKCNGIIGNCLLILIGKRDDVNLSLEEKAIRTAWFINNKREYKKEKEQAISNWREREFINIDANRKDLDGRKCQFTKPVINFLGIEGVQVEKGKLKWIDSEKKLMVLKSKARTRGWWIDYPNILIKLV